MSCITWLVLTFGGGIFTSDVAVLTALRNAAPLVALTQFSLPLTTTIDVRKIPITATFSSADSSVHFSHCPTPPGFDGCGEGFWMDYPCSHGNMRAPAGDA